eukprot:COSAG06_NODE_13520_length_1249_cov_1.144348_1_plen_104_part_00
MCLNTVETMLVVFRVVFSPLLQPVKLRPYWNEQQWLEHAGTIELWQSKMEQHEVLMLLLLRMAELDLPHGGNGLEGVHPISARLRLLQKLDTLVWKCLFCATI